MWGWVICQSEVPKMDHVSNFSFYILVIETHSLLRWNYLLTNFTYSIHFDTLSAWRRFVIQRNSILSGWEYDFDFFQFEKGTIKQEYCKSWSKRLQCGVLVCLPHTLGAPLFDSLPPLSLWSLHILTVLVQVFTRFCGDLPHSKNINVQLIIHRCECGYEWSHILRMADNQSRV